MRKVPLLQKMWNDLRIVCVYVYKNCAQPVYDAWKKTCTKPALSLPPALTYWSSVGNYPVLTITTLMLYGRLSTAIFSHLTGTPGRLYSQSTGPITTITKYITLKNHIVSAPNFGTRKRYGLCTQGAF